MEKNCSSCKSKHTAPFGSRCKLKMAVLEGYTRDDPKYLKQLEEEFCQLKLVVTSSIAEGGKGIKIDPTSTDTPTKADMDRVFSSLDRITDRLDKIERPSVHGASGGTSDPGLSAASLMADPLTKALAKLVGEEDDRGKALRPENYSQSDLKDKSRDHTKLDTVDLFYGWVCVAQHLMHTRGDLASYMKHLRYSMEMLHTRQFYDAGAVKYDRMIINKYLEGKATGFDPDPVISSLSFSSKIIPDNVELCPGASLTKGVISYVQNKVSNKARKRGQPSRRSDDVPPDFPSDICFMYNYRQCVEDSCSKAHICRKCSGKHRADGCREKTRKS